MAVERATIIIPTFNGASRIERCLLALRHQPAECEIETLVVDDGSTDSTADVVGRYPSVRLIQQNNAGPAAARNRGAREARGDVLLFTDDDCEPAPGWLHAMLAPFQAADVVGVKGVYRTHQRDLIARFVQKEYEDRYLLMNEVQNVDFIDTYSAAFRRGAFLALGGYDTSFPVACAEDIDLSYRMAGLGWKMRFAPDAVVFHIHPATLRDYLRKKYKFAYWRMLALRKSPRKAIKDSHTPQLMKLQLMLLPFLVLATLMDLVFWKGFPATLAVVLLFVASTLPFAIRTLTTDVTVGVASPVLLACRSFVQLLGITAGTVHAMRTPTPPAANPAVRQQSVD